MCEGPRSPNERLGVMDNNDKRMTDMIYARDEDGLRAAAEMYGSLCRRVAAGILASPEDAEECFNDALLAVWNSIPPNRPASLSAYICRITRNIAINRFKASPCQKRGGGDIPLPLSELEECLPGSGDESQSDSAEISAVIDRWLAKQPKTVRLLFVGRYFEGADTKALAKNFGMSDAGVRSALHRARLSLRRELENADITL